MGTVIAERGVEVRTEDGLAPGNIRIFAPEHHPADDTGGDYWGCQIEFDFDAFQRSRVIKGVDAYQALQLALKMVPVEIEATPVFRNKQLMLWGNPLTDTSTAFSMEPFGEA